MDCVLSAKKGDDCVALGRMEDTFSQLSSGQRTEIQINSVEVNSWEGIPLPKFR